MHLAQQVLRIEAKALEGAAHTVRTLIEAKALEGAAAAVAARTVLPTPLYR